MSDYDTFLDIAVEDYYEGFEEEAEEPEWDGPYPDDYDNYDGWDDM